MQCRTASSWVILLVAQASLFALWWAGMTLEGFARLYEATLGLTGAYSVSRPVPNLLAVDDQLLRVTYSCTPTTLCAGAFFLLWIKLRQKALRYVAACMIVAITASICFSINVVISVALYKRGIPWDAVHQSGLGIIYFLTLILCLRIVRNADSPWNDARELSETPASAW